MLVVIAMEPGSLLGGVLIVMLLLEVVLRGFEHRGGVITCVQLVKGGSAVRVGQGLLVGLVAVLGWGRL